MRKPLKGSGCDHSISSELAAVLEKAAAEMSTLETDYIKAWRRILRPLAKAAGYADLDNVIDELAVVHRDDNLPESWKKALSLHIRKQQLEWDQEILNERRKALGEEERR